MSIAVVPFSLEDTSGANISFPGQRPSLVCFVKEDCPTCHAVMPVLAELYQVYQGNLDIHVIGQTQQGNTVLENQYSPPFSLLDDSTLKVSFATDIEIVPSLFWTDEHGQTTQCLVGFVRDEWQQLCADLDLVFETNSSDIDWSAFPEWRAGCGSMSADPLIADRLRAQSQNSPLRARKIDIGSGDDDFEFMFDQGFSDGLPLVPPTPERVLRMLAGSNRDPQEVLAIMPPNMGEVTVEKVAINAVMAGCMPQYMPIINTVVQAICTDEYNIHGVMATTMGASPVIVVNGPIREQIDMNMKLGALGQGNRANATIGRAVRLLLRNMGGARPGGTERSTLGNPMKFTMCFAEWEERNPWQPLHVERGFNASDSVVTIFTMTSGPTLIVDQDSRSAGALAGTMGLCLEAAFNPKAHYATDCLLVVVPEHIDTLMRDGYSKADLRQRIQEVTARPIRELVADDVSGTGFKAEVAASMSEEQLDRRLPKFKSEDDIHIVVAGSEAGKFSAAFHGWATGEIGSISVSRKIDEI
ncbi:MAG: TlpA family protein disulfide reductase [Gammaproteobacteria bacterium]|nr:TlpA family protein disulfide reductase [Gammaproteobacteria bacterium]